MRSNRKKILITGASGYIGRNLHEYFQKKYFLYTPSHQTLDLLDDKMTETFFRNHDIDIVIHTALVGGSRQEEQVQNAFLANTKMFFNILRNQRFFDRLIHFGSGAEYDKRRPLKRIKESQFDERVPHDEYGFFKYLCSCYIKNTRDIINLRIFGIFGKHEDYKLRFISNAIVNNLFGLPIIMNQNVFFDYLYIGDFVRIVERFIHYESVAKFYNIGYGSSIDLLTIAKKINSIADKPSQIIVKKKGLNNEYTCDNSLLMKELGQFKFTDFDHALKKLYQWYRSIKGSLILPKGADKRINRNTKEA